MKRKKILFTGYYGQRNTGDDAFVEVASWGANKYWSSPDSRFLAKKRRLPITEIETKGYPLSLPKSYRFQNQYLLRNADFLISAGGSTIHSKMKLSTPKAMAVSLKKKYGKIKIGGIGVSIGPFKTKKDEKAVQEYLKMLDFLALRDNFSYQYARSLQLPYEPINAFDLAALLPNIYSVQEKRKNQKKKKTIGISVCPYESIHPHLDPENEILRNEKMIRLIKEIDRLENIHFKFYVINGHKKVGDLDLTNQTIHASRPESFEIVPYNPHTKVIWESINQCDFMISTRMHGAIFACFADTPFMLNEYHRKCSDFLNDIGYEEDYRLYNNQFDEREKAIQIKEILQEPNSYKLPSYVSKMRTKAELNFTSISI